MRQEYRRTRYRLCGCTGGFIDPARKVAEDSRKNYGETRYNMLAKVDDRIFHVTFTERGKIVWIISARKANKREQRRYEQG